MVERRVGDKVIRLIRGDITDMEVDAFVFDITADCKLGSGYGGAIATRGGKAVQDQLGAVGTLPTGEAVVTTGGTLKAKFIIHVNGPKFHEPDTDGQARAQRAAARSGGPTRRDSRRWRFRRSARGCTRCRSTCAPR